MEETTRNYKRFYMLLKQLPHADKDTLVWQYTQGRTKSLKETSEWEYGVMCRDMERVVNNDNKVALKQAALRRHAAEYCTSCKSMGWTPPTGQP